MSHRRAPALVADLRGRLQRALDPLVPVGATVALVDYPWHSNVGDSAIWSGELAYLRQRGARIVHTCDNTGYDARLLRARLGPDGIVLLHGGGNFGDLYRRHQRLREQVLADVPGHRVVQLPQTVNFSTSAALREFTAQHGRRTNLHVLVRDTASLDALSGRLANPVLLAPDSAFLLDPVEVEQRAAHPVVALLRTDGESAGFAGAARRAGVDEHDWLDRRLDRRTRPSDRLASLLRKVERRVPAGAASRPLSDVVATVHSRRARAEYHRGVRLLRRGEVVITDRLHGHLLAFVNGIPSVVLGDKHGKVLGVSGQWIGEHELVRRAGSLDDAVQLAGLLRDGRW